MNEGKTLAERDGYIDPGLLWTHTIDPGLSWTHTSDVLFDKFEAAVLPMPNDLVGKWKIKVLTGALPDMSHLGHIKIIKRNKKGLLVGVNKVLCFTSGSFHIQFNLRQVIFQYDKYDFIDIVRKSQDGSLIGKYKAELGGLKFAGWFRMIRNG